MKRRCSERFCHSTEGNLVTDIILNGGRKSQRVAMGRRSNTGRAITYFYQSLIVAKETGRRAREGDVYEKLGRAYHFLGDHKQAVTYFSKYLIIAKEMDKKGCRRRRVQKAW